MSGNNPQNPRDVEEYFPIDDVPIKVDRDSIKITFPQSYDIDSYGGKKCKRS